MRRKLGKADGIVFGVLVLVCAALLLVFWRMSAAGGDTVTITVDGEIYGSYPLDKNREIPVEQDGAVTNVVCIRDGKAFMKEADCPDHLCMRQGEISSDHATIVCLPNRVVVEISSEEEAKMDGVSG